MNLLARASAAQVASVSKGERCCVVFTGPLRSVCKKLGAMTLEGRTVKRPRPCEWIRSAIAGVLMGIGSW